MLAIVGMARFTGGQDRIPWRDDLNAARKEAAARHKPLFLDFTASWCGPCQSLRTSTCTDENVARTLENYVPVRIDIDAHPELSEQYGVQSIPLFVVQGSNSAPIKRSEGYMDADEFLDWLNH